METGRIPHVHDPEDRVVRYPKMKLSPAVRQIFDVELPLPVEDRLADIVVDRRRGLPRDACEPPSEPVLARFAQKSGSPG